MKTQEVKLLFKRVNAKRVDFPQEIWDNPVTIEDPKQGIEFLIKQWKTPQGKERKNNPFGYREENVLENFEYLELAGYYEQRNGYKIPLYNVIGRESSFTYYYDFTGLNIIG